MRLAARLSRVRAPAAAAGALSGLAGYGTTGGAPLARCQEAPAAFSSSEFRAFPVVDVRDATHNTKVLRCKLPSDQHRMGMTVSSMVMVRGAKKGDDAPARPYTPITTDDQKGFFDLMVKGYPKGVVSKHICSLKPGDMVEVKGPFAKLAYTANMKKSIGMIAGGSGITPMLQVMKEILSNPADKTEVTLIYANQTPADILLRDELDEMVASSGGRFKVCYAVDGNDSFDAGIWHVGYVTPELVQSVLPAPSADTLVYVCGPPPMMVAVSGNKKFEKGKPPAQGEVEGVLNICGYTKDMVYKF